MIRRASVGLLALASAGHLVAYVVAAPAHIVDATWPLHGRFHVFQALLWIVGFDALALLLAVGPHRRGDRWALFALAAAWPFSHLSYFLGLLVIPGGGPSLGASAVMASLAALYALGLAAGWRRPG